MVGIQTGAGTAEVRWCAASPAVGGNCNSNGPIRMDVYLVAKIRQGDYKVKFATGRSNKFHHCHLCKFVIFSD